MLPWEIVEVDRTLDGVDLVLAHRGSEWEVRVGRDTLMSSRASGSELDLARLAFEVAPHTRRVLVGGLGLGFSLRAVLDLLPEGRSSFEERVYPALAAAGSLEAELVDRDFLDIGNPDDRAHARSRLSTP